VLIPIASELASVVPGTLLMRAGIKFDADGSPVLVPETDPDALNVPAGAVLVSASYISMRPHVRFECNRKDLGVIHSYVPTTTNNWSRRSFLAVMLPGTEISFVVQEPVRRPDPSNPGGSFWTDKEVTTVLLRLNEEGKFEYLYNEVPFMDTSDTSWMPGRKPSDEERFLNEAFESEAPQSIEPAKTSDTTGLGTKTYVRCENMPFDDALLDPFLVGEGISHTTVYKLNGEAPAPLAYRPFGVLTIVGDVAAVLPAVLAWIDPEATVSNIGLSWRDVISAKLLRGESVNIDELPAGVLLKRLDRKNGNRKSNNLPGNVFAKASAIVASLLALLTKSRK
jgi:hypothetical protein